MTMAAPRDSNHSSQATSTESEKKHFVGGAAPPLAEGKFLLTQQPASTSGKPHNVNHAPFHRMSRQYLLDCYAQLKRKGQVADEDAALFFVLAPVKHDARPVADAHEGAEPGGVVWPTQRDPFNQQDPSLHSLTGGYRGRAIDFSAAPKGRGAGGRRIDDHHTAVNAVSASSATGKPFRNPPGGRGRGARFPQHDARETCAKVESCAPVITTCVSSSNSVNSTAVGVLETTKNGGMPRLSASGQPHNVEAKNSASRNTQNQNEILEWRRKDRPVLDVTTSNTSAASASVSGAPSAAHGFGFGRYSAAGVQGSSTVSPCMQNTPAYSGFMTPPTTFPKLERLPDRRARPKPANDVGDAPPKHTVTQSITNERRDDGRRLPAWQQHQQQENQDDNSLARKAWSSSGREQQQQQSLSTVPETAQRPLPESDASSKLVSMVEGVKVLATDAAGKADVSHVENSGQPLSRPETIDKEDASDLTAAQALVYQLLERLKQRPQDLHQMSAADLLSKLRPLGLGAARQTDGLSGVESSALSSLPQQTFCSGPTPSPGGSSVAANLVDRRLLQSMRPIPQEREVSHDSARPRPSDNYPVDSTVNNVLASVNSGWSSYQPPFISKTVVPPHNLVSESAKNSVVPQRAFVDPAIQHASVHSVRIDASSAVEGMGHGGGVAPHFTSAMLPNQTLPLHTATQSLNAFHPLDHTSSGSDASTNTRHLAFQDANDRAALAARLPYISDERQRQRIISMFQQLHERGLRTADVLAVADSLTYQRNNNTRSQNVTHLEQPLRSGAVCPPTTDQRFNGIAGSHVSESATAANVNRGPLGVPIAQQHGLELHTAETPLGSLTAPSSSSYGYHPDVRLTPTEEASLRSVSLHPGYHPSLRPFFSSENATPSVDRSRLLNCSHPTASDASWLDAASDGRYFPLDGQHASTRPTAARMAASGAGIQRTAALQGSDVVGSCLPPLQTFDVQPSLHAAQNVAQHFDGGLRENPAAAVAQASRRPTSLTPLVSPANETGNGALNTVRYHSNSSLVTSDPQATAESLIPQSLHKAVWEYRDPTGQIQGPFTSLQMAAWWEGNFFPSDLLMRYHSSLPWVPFNKLYPLHLYHCMPPFSLPLFPIVSPNGTVSHPFVSAGNVLPSVKPYQMQHELSNATASRHEPPQLCNNLESAVYKRNHLLGQKLDHRPAGVTSAAMMTHDLKSILGLTTKSPLLETERPLEAHDKSCNVAPNESMVAAGGRTEKHTSQIEAPTSTPTPIPAQNAVSKTAAQTQRRPASVTQHPVKGTDTSQKQLQQDNFASPAQSAAKKGKETSHLAGGSITFMPSNAVAPQPVDMLTIMREEALEQEAREQEARLKLATTEKPEKSSWKVLPVSASSSPFDEEEFPDPSALHHKGSLKNGGGKTKVSLAGDASFTKGSKKPLHEFIKTKTPQTSSAPKSVWNRVANVVAQPDRPAATDSHCTESNDAPPEPQVAVGTANVPPQAGQQTEQAISQPTARQTARDAAVHTKSTGGDDSSASNWMTVSSSKKKLVGPNALHDKKRKGHISASATVVQPSSAIESESNKAAVAAAPPANISKQEQAASLPPLTTQELSEIDKLLKHCSIDLDSSMVEYLRTFKTAEGIVEFLKDNLSHEKTQLSFFATEFIAVLQHPFTTVSYVKGGHAGDHAAAPTGGSYPWKQNNTGWTKVTSSKNSPSSSLPNNNVNAAGVATRASANKPSNATDGTKKNPGTGQQQTSTKQNAQSGGKVKEGKRAGKGKKGKAAVDAAHNTASVQR